MSTAPAAAKGASSNPYAVLTEEDRVQRRAERAKERAERRRLREEERAKAEAAASTSAAPKWVPGSRWADAELESDEEAWSAAQPATAGKTRSAAAAKRGGGKQQQQVRDAFFTDCEEDEDSSDFSSSSAETDSQDSESDAGGATDGEATRAEASPRSAAKGGGGVGHHPSKRKSKSEQGKSKESALPPHRRFCEAKRGGPRLSGGGVAATFSLGREADDPLKNLTRKERKQWEMELLEKMLSDMGSERCILKGGRGLLPSRSWASQRQQASSEALGLALCSLRRCS